MPFAPWRRWITAALASTIVSCGAPARGVVTLTSPARVPRPAERDRVPLEVVTRGTGVADPLPVEGTGVAYGQVETSLGWSVLDAATAWSDAHPVAPGGGFQLTVELTRAEAKWTNGRLSVSLGSRATLRSRLGNRYIAQTNARCDQAGLSAPEAGQPIFDSCTKHIGRTLASWLDGVALDPNPVRP